MKKKYLKISIRNFAIIIILLIISVFSAELLLSQSDTAPDIDNTDSTDADTALYLRYEKTSPEALMTAADEAKNLVNSGFVPSETCSYPLICDMSSSEIFDNETVNIVVIGDSFVWGDSIINRNALFWRLLEQKFRKNGFNCKVQAVAVRGANAYEELSWLEKGIINDLSPDIIIFGYVYNDALQKGDDYINKEDTPTKEKSIIIKTAKKLIPSVYERISSYISAKTLYTDRYDGRYDNTNIALLRDENLSYYKKNFVAKLDAISKKYQIPAVVVTLPNDTKNILLKELYKPLDYVFEDTDIGYYNSLSAFSSFSEKKHKANIHVNSKNAHPGNAANYFYSEFIYNFLLKDYSSVFKEKKDSDLSSKTKRINECTPSGIGLKELSCSNDQAVYEFIYPDVNIPKDYLFLTIYPYCLFSEKTGNYVKLCLEKPAEITKVALSGDFEKAEVFYTKINEKLGYDDNTIYSFDAAEGFTFSKKLGERVTSICVHIPDNEGERNIKISIS